MATCSNTKSKYEINVDPLGKITLTKKHPTIPPEQPAGYFDALGNYHTQLKCVGKKRNEKPYEQTSP